jgi:hypothetical protein
MCRHGHLDVFRGLGLVAIMCWESIRLIAGKIGRVIEDWASGNWHDLDDESSSGTETWKCDLCGAIGKGDASSFFGLAEIEHFLESRCKGSLRQHAVPELAVASYAQQENRTPVQTTTSLNRASPSIAQSNESIAIGYDAYSLSSPPVQSLEPGQTRQVCLGMGSTWMEAGRRLFINVVAKESFKVQSLVVPSSVADHFMIESLSIGSRHLLPYRITATMFTEAFPYFSFFLRDVGYSEVVTVSVANTGRKGKWFQGVLMGPAIDKSLLTPRSTSCNFSSQSLP